MPTKLRQRLDLLARRAQALDAPSWDDVLAAELRMRQRLEIALANATGERLSAERAALDDSHSDVQRDSENFRLYLQAQGLDMHALARTARQEVERMLDRLACQLESSLSDTQNGPAGY